MNLRRNVLQTIGDFIESFHKMWDDRFNKEAVMKNYQSKKSEFSFLLWTHGLVQSNEVLKPYYQGKRGIPRPLLIKRFREQTLLKQLQMIF